MELYKIGDTKTLTIPLLNKSATTATNVVVTITLTEGLAYSTSTPTDGTVTVLSPRDITWNIPTVLGSELEELSLTVIFTSSCYSTYTVTWEATCDQPETKIYNNTDCYTYEGLSCCTLLTCLTLEKEDFVKTSGTTVTLSESPLMILLVTRGGLETIDYTYLDGVLTFTDEFGYTSGGDGVGETVIVTYFKNA